LNSIGRKVLKALERTSLQGMSIHVLNRQAEIAKVDLDRLDADDLPALQERFQEVLPYFIGQNGTDALISELGLLTDETRNGGSLL